MPIEIINTEKVSEKEGNTSQPATIGTGETIVTAPDDININDVGIDDPSSDTNPQKTIGVVEINNRTAPLVVLFGPTSCGKTMTLVCLTRHLRSKGIVVTPDISFRSGDQDYINDCDRFNDMVDNPIAAPGTSGYMLVDVIARGKVLCKILEAPGELYFDPQDPSKQYPHYLNTIMTAPNRKVWCTFVEPSDWGDAKSRASYVNRIANLKPEMKHSDSMIFIFNKVDKLKDLIKAPGVINEKLLLKCVSDNYPGIFIPFENDIPIYNLIHPYDCYRLPFTTGKYTESVDNNGNKVVLYCSGPDVYPARLWKLIKKSI